MYAQVCANNRRENPHSGVQLFRYNSDSVFLIFFLYLKIFPTFCADKRCIPCIIKTKKLNRKLFIASLSTFSNVAIFKDFSSLNKKR